MSQVPHNLDWLVKTPVQIPKSHACITRQGIVAAIGNRLNYISCLGITQSKIVTGGLKSDLHQQVCARGSTPLLNSPRSACKCLYPN